MKENVLKMDPEIMEYLASINDEKQLPSKSMMTAIEEENESEHKIMPVFQNKSSDLNERKIRSFMSLDEYQNKYLLPFESNCDIFNHCKQVLSQMKALFTALNKNNKKCLYEYNKCENYISVVNEKFDEIKGEHGRIIEDMKNISVVVEKYYQIWSLRKQFIS